MKILDVYKFVRLCRLLTEFILKYRVFVDSFWDFFKSYEKCTQNLNVTNTYGRLNMCELS